MVSVKFKTHTDDTRIPCGCRQREYDEDSLDPTIRASGCRWVARHEGLDHPCDWHSWHRSYPAAVLAARGHAGRTCLHLPTKRRRGRTR